MKFTDATKPDGKSGGSRGTCSLCVAKRNPVVVVAPYTFALPEGETAGPSASLGMTKFRAVTFVRSRQIGWIERNPTRFVT
jgi:hypothetical protein